MKRSASLHPDVTDVAPVLWELCRKLNRLHEAKVIDLLPIESFALGAACGLAEQVTALRNEVKDLEQALDQERERSDD